MIVRCDDNEIQMWCLDDRSRHISHILAGGWARRRGDHYTTISENNIIISKPATFEIQSEELTHLRVLWPFWSRGGSPRVSPHSFPPTLEFPEYVVAKGWMLSVDRPVGSIPLGFGAIRPAWFDFACESSRRFDLTGFWRDSSRMGRFR